MYTHNNYFNLNNSEPMSKVFVLLLTLKSCFFNSCKQKTPVSNSQHCFFRILLHYKIRTIHLWVNIKNTLILMVPIWICRNIARISYCMEGDLRRNTLTWEFYKTLSVQHLQGGPLNKWTIEGERCSIVL